jgi:hypothetical protein
MIRWSRPILIALGVVLVPWSARAAGPNKLECIAANDDAQDLRRAGKLREAREKLLLCGSTSCPGLVREDCAQRLTEVDHVMPSIVFEVKDGAGSDVAGVTVTLDGQQLPGKLSGLPVQVDPGEHRFVFEAQGLPATEKTIVVREGEHDRHERVVLGQPGAPAPSTPVPSSSEAGSQKTIAYVAGGAGVVGLVLGGVFGLVSKGTYNNALQNECGGNPNACSTQGAQDGQTAHSQATISTVGFIAGGALLAGGAVLYFTSPKGSAVAVAPTVGTAGGGLNVTGGW